LRGNPKRMFIHGLQLNYPLLIWIEYEQAEYFDFRRRLAYQEGNS